MTVTPRHCEPKAKQSTPPPGLPQRFAPRNDGHPSSLRAKGEAIHTVTRIAAALRASQ